MNPLSALRRLFASERAPEPRMTPAALALREWSDHVVPGSARIRALLMHDGGAVQYDVTAVQYEDLAEVVVYSGSIKDAWRLVGALNPPVEEITP